METNACSHENFTNSVDAAIKPVYGCLFFKFLNAENSMETKSLYIACLSLSTSVDKMETKPIDKSRAVRQTKNNQKPNHAVLISVCYLRTVISFPFVICQFDLSRAINTNGSDRTNRFCLLSVHSIQNHIPSHRDVCSDDFRLSTSCIRTIWKQVSQNIRVCEIRYFDA